ncbi:DNA polymerase beta superfamily protein [Motiliproteus sp. MSK22-1]|uniref:nucleotidyltransferase domain-containing protein n=1 Tax=Motiliproteus sp. MSK22-1 TaxID=1897630 RepID=UPI000978A530|nr:nucleotidyltransferase domain-containing protein [Motiliproteus sp. MSK22-1]OMH32767.1 nucleotidyltransferase [Motiliproteus sp. MSK22-1]
MSCKTAYLIKAGLLKSPPKFLSTGVQYEVVMGSIAYGVAEDKSDMDVYGFAIPPRDWVFPHLRGEMPGFDEAGPSFEQIQQHHMLDKSARAGKGQEYDLTVYSIVKYFRLLLENNPNIIDSLFVPRNCILYSTSIGEMVREQRHIFLHKGCWPRFKGYAYAQVNRMKSKQAVGKRKEVIDEYGYDLKFAYHVVRLLNEVEQILIEGDLDLARNKEQLKAIRRGEWSLDRVEEYFVEKEKQLEKLYFESTLPVEPDKLAVKDLLLQCLEQHYGSLDDCIVREDQAVRTLNEIKAIIQKNCPD